MNVLPTRDEEASEEWRTEDFGFPSSGLSSCCDLRQVVSGAFVQKVCSEVVSAFGAASA